MNEKKVDESWKEKVAQEQQASAQEEDVENNTHACAKDVKKEEEAFEMPPVNFNLFISSLSMQALMALGEIENPISNKKDKQLPQAKYLIDTIEMLQVKTKGNLDAQEADMIETILYELRMKYIALTKD
ncbi:MAG: DUF1844 domain-containing protein [Candidatus Omnitrophica bacterium]|nr:DUF1844 domain-containing protein [Candidatus Omnitrophota bacterium]